MGRGAITYSAAYLAGITAVLAFGIPLPPIPVLILSSVLISASYITRKRAMMFLFATHSALFLTGAGAASAAVGREDSGLPEGRVAAIISGECSRLRTCATGYLATIVPGREEHATLCALAIGEKRLMDRKLRQDYSRAGAMHVLALSGLHIAVLFAIMYRSLSPLCLVPWGNRIRNILAIGAILGYSIFTGASPSVMRAAFMILIYKVAGMSFRQVGKWDAMALSAMMICMIDPLQIKDIGFQLSYAAVIGITLLYPTCRDAYRQLSHLIWGGKSVAWLAEKVWDSISISVCCQITTLPFVLWYFGSAPDWFLLANLVAVPVSTAILYLAVVAAVLQPVPAAGELSAEILASAIRFMNNSVGYISN